MQFLLPILILIALVYLSYRLRFFHLEELTQWAAPALLLTKIFFGFALWAVYTFYYTDRSTSDIYKFYDDAHYAHLAFSENKSAFLGLMTGSEDSSLAVYTGQMKNWDRVFNKAIPFNENRFMIRLNAIMMLISGENIHVHTILFCFLSFLGCMLLLKLFQQLLEPGKKKWVLITLLFPSFLFWTSGGLKESLMVLALGMLLYGFLLIRQRAWRAVLLFVIGFLFLLLVKYFLLLSLLPVLVAYYLFLKKATLRDVASKYSGIILISLVILQGISTLDQRVNFALIISKRQEVALSEARYMKAGSFSEVPHVAPSFISVIIHLPVGLWDSIMKPYLWQTRNPMIMLSGAENILMIALILLTILYRDRKKKYDYNLLFFFAISVILYFSIIGLITPVLGNLVRYKVIMMPMLVFILLYIADLENLPMIGRKKQI